ncbi:MAG: hypothetical protein MZV70_43440 [Desulfobacterales bacterium]|nr:hypothetical protein [Desulfobacterales bacterium]
MRDGRRPFPGGEEDEPAGDRCGHRSRAHWAPGLVLTSMTKHIDVAVFESVKSCSRWKILSGGLKDLRLEEKTVLALFTMIKTKS